MVFVPERQAALAQIVQIVQQQLFQACARHPHQLQFELLGGAAGLAPFCNILPAAARSLYHLIMSARPFFNEPVAKLNRTIVHDFGHFCALAAAIQPPYHPGMKIADIPAVHRALARAFGRVRAPVIDLVAAQTHDPFKVLVGTILSARTKDQTTAAACARLFARVQTAAALRQVPLTELERLIFPVGFFHTKARHLKQLPDVLEKKFNGRIPQTVEELCELPGVGRKTANLVVVLGFDQPGICVDVHVHRICNRLGLLCTRTPLETEMTLRQILPPRFWKTWNSYLVAFGQTQCLPARPRCEACPVRKYCQTGRKAGTA